MKTPKPPIKELAKELQHIIERQVDLALRKHDQEKEKLLELTVELGDKVSDTWYPEAGTGIITEILKTRLKVYFERATFKDGWQCPLFRYAKENGVLTYDKPHYRFLTHENTSSKR